MPRSSFTSGGRSRAVAAAVAVALQALIGWALITGLSGKVVTALTQDIAVFNVEVVTPPPPPVPVRKAARRPSGAAAPPHARAHPTPVVAPPPVIRLPPPPPLIVTAPLAALGADATAGAANAGVGTGAGGQGNGLGAGSGGNGTGAGGTPARQIAGEITGRDYPPAARDTGTEGDLTTRYVIDARGRITRCSILKSSGSEILDSTTCRLAIKRFRYAPARDAGGHPVEDLLDDDHHWHIAQDAPDD